MGSETNNISCYIYKVGKNNKKDNLTNYYSVFDKTPFAQGAFRYCYKGEIMNKNGKCTNSEIFPSGKCVVKVFKEKVAHHLSDFEEDFKGYFYAMEVSQIFNSLYSYLFLPEIHFMAPYATSLYKHSSFELFGFIPIRDDDSMKKIKENEWLAIEPFIEGNYKKYISNTCTYCTITDDDKAISLFMHWNWVYSEGRTLVSDIQGIKKNKHYELTDPAIQSINNEFGQTDLGILGLICFVIRHKHNEYCKDLPWPKEKEIQKISEYALPMQRSTRFIWNIIEIYQFEKGKEFINQKYMDLLDSVFNKKRSKTRCLVF